MTATIAGRTVTIASEDRQQPLSKATWLVLGCRGFETETQARQFGEALRRAAHLAGLSARVGVDAGDPGEDRTLSWFNPEVILPDLRREHPEMRLGPDLHGIAILPDDENTLFVTGRAELANLSNAEYFVQALEDALPDADAPPSGSPAIRRAIRSLNLAEMSGDSIAKTVLAISTVEGLATDPPWSDDQAKLIEDTAKWLEDAHGDEEGAEQVIEAIRRVRMESIRQRIKKLLETNGLSSHWRDWDDLYRKRSKLLHGQSGARSEARGDHLDQAELHRFGHEAITLCARIVLSIAKRDGVPVPDRAKVHFQVE